MEETKQISPYHRLKAEKDAEIEDLKKKLEAMQTSGNSVPVVDTESVMEDIPLTDDRKEIVEVNLGKDYNWATYKIPKEEAVEKLVSAYINNKTKVIPRVGAAGELINQHPCYAKVVKRDITGKKLTFYKDMKLHMIVERIVNHPNSQIELVPKSEYLEFDKDRIAEELNWQKPLQRRKVEKAIDVLASM